MNYLQLFKCLIDGSKRLLQIKSSEMPTLPNCATLQINKFLLSASAIISIWFTSQTYAQIEEKLDLIRLPPNFAISLYANVPDARSLEIVPELEAVFVGTRSDTVYKINDKGLKGKPESISKFVEKLKVPNGIAYKDGQLYIAEQHRILAVNVIDKTQKILLEGLPNEKWHGWRYMALSPNGKLYVSIGSPCNVCTVQGIEGTIIEVDPSTGEFDIFAHGVRNSVGIGFHPNTGELYFTDNGSDGLGDEIPPDELNHAPVAGLHFGFPWFGGGNTKSDEFYNDPTPEGVIYPIVNFQAHAASLGFLFHSGKQFPQKYSNSIFVTQHGSWNRTVPTGNRIMHLLFDKNGNFLEKSIFAQGWLQGENSWGRVVDIKEMPDGSLLASDDKAGVIYRISYEK